MRIGQLVLFSMLAMALLVLGAGPAHAGATRTTFSGIEVNCATVPGEQWISGNVLHVRGERSTLLAVSADPLGNGTNHVVTNLNLNLNTGRGTAWGTFDYRPTGYDGGFAGHFHATIGVGFSGSGVGHGSGVFEGTQLRVELTGVPTPPDNPCPSDAMGADRFDATLLHPGN